MSEVERDRQRDQHARAHRQHRPVPRHGRELNRLVARGADEGRHALAEQQAEQQAQRGGQQGDEQRLAERERQHLPAREAQRPQLPNLAAALRQRDGKGVIDQERAGEQDGEARKRQRKIGQDGDGRTRTRSRLRAGDDVEHAEVCLQLVASLLDAQTRFQPDEDGGRRAGRVEDGLQGLERQPRGGLSRSLAGFQQSDDGVRVRLVAGGQRHVRANADSVLRGPRRWQKDFKCIRRGEERSGGELIRGQRPRGVNAQQRQSSAPERDRTQRAGGGRARINRAFEVTIDGRGGGDLGPGGDVGGE